MAARSVWCEYPWGGRVRHRHVSGAFGRPGSLGHRVGRGAQASGNAGDDPHLAVHAGYREPHDRLSAVAPGDSGDRRPGRGAVPGLLGVRGDLPRSGARALSGRRRPSDPPASHAARVRAAGPVARGSDHRAPVPPVAGFLRGPHGVGRDQRADDAHRVPAAGSARRASRAHEPARADHARRGAPLLLLLSPGRAAPAPSCRRADRQAPGRPLLGARRERCAAIRRARVHGELPLRRLAWASRGTPRRRDNS